MSALLSVHFAEYFDFSTPLLQSVARVVGAIFDEGELPSVRTIREKCYEAGVRSPTHGANGRVSYGTVDRVLRRLRKVGAIRWAAAYVHRWHFGRWEPSPENPRVRWMGKCWRLPARALALGTSWIERPRPPEPMREATQSASAQRQGAEVSSQPIQPQREAASAASKIEDETLRLELQRRWGWRS